MAKTPKYKLEQKKTREALKRGTVLWFGKTPLNMGIKQFKREHKGDNWMIKTYKDNLWDGLRKAMAEQEEAQAKVS